MERQQESATNCSISVDKSFKLTSKIRQTPTACRQSKKFVECEKVFLFLAQFFLLTILKKFSQPQKSTLLARCLRDVTQISNQVFYSHYHFDCGKHSVICILIKSRKNLFFLQNLRNLKNRRFLQNANKRSIVSLSRSNFTQFFILFNLQAHV